MIAAATFGALLARHRHLDLVGAITVTFLVASGGGTLRDVLLNRQPLLAAEHPDTATRS